MLVSCIYVAYIYMYERVDIYFVSDVDHDPSQAARAARKARVAKNERQRLQNLARAEGVAAERDERKRDIEKTLATTRVSTASMGKFDKRLEGEKKLKGVKRKVCHYPSVTSLRWL